MSRDMKHLKRSPAPKKSAGGTLVGMFIGLVVGVGVAAGIVWYMNKAPLPFVEKVQPTAKPETKGGQAKQAAPAAPEAGEPAILPGKPGDAVPEKRFQFYDILPGKADAVPDKAAPAKPEAKKDEPKKEDRKDEVRDSKSPMFLQAGSFSSAEDADNQRAKLAFMGYESVVQQVMIQDKTFYRVRVGPYVRSEDMNRVRAELAKSGIEAQLSK